MNEEWKPFSAGVAKGFIFSSFLESVLFMAELSSMASGIKYELIREPLMHGVRVRVKKEEAETVSEKIDELYLQIRKHNL